MNTTITHSTSTIRIMAYLEPEAYSEHCQTSTMERFAKRAILHSFLCFKKWNFLAFRSSKSIKNPFLKSFLYFRKWDFLAPSLKTSYISGDNLQHLKNQKSPTFPSKHKRKRKKFLILILIKKQNFLNYNYNNAFFLIL